MTIPNPPEIALALAIVKSKPPGRSVRDFATGFRDAITRQEHGLGIDLCTYWRNESRRLQAELDKSVAISAALRAESHKGIGTDLQDQPSRKHRGGSLADVRATKRTRAESGDSLQTERQLMGMLFDLRQRHIASPTDVGTLSALCCQTASTLGDIISKHSRDANTVTSSMPDILRVARRIVVCLLQGLDSLNLHSVSSPHVGSALHAIIHLFSTILAIISNGQPPTNKLFNRTRNDEPSENTNGLAGILEAMYESLDTNKQHHAELFEGFTYHLLERVGRTLHTVTPAPDDPQPSLRDLQVSLHVGTPLLSILSTALRHAPRSFRTSRTQGLQADSSLHLQSRHSLTTKALAKLQRTLVHAALGETLDPLDAAAERLHAPKSPPPTTTRRRTTAKRKDPTPQEQADAWKAQLWSCLGWEILAYEGRLAELLNQGDDTK